MLDHENLRNRFSGWTPVQITEANGMPPERYQFRYNLKGLYVAPNGQILERHEHLLEVNLSLGYPRRAPHCKMLTPIFHPNFDETSVCIGDFWAASEGLDDLIIRIGRMISYQEYNTKSPLNGLAAKWAAEHLQMLPVDTTEVTPPQPEANDTEDTTQEFADSAWGNQTIIINDAGATSSAVATAPPATSTQLKLSSELKFSSIVVTCNHCEQSMELKAKHLGRQFNCPNCRATHEANQV